MDGVPPIRDAQRRVLVEAAEEARSLLAAARLARVNAWVFGTFAALSILSGMGSPVALLVGVGLAVVARNEFVGGQRVARFDVSGLQLLWRNQVGLLALIVGSALWGIYRATRAPAPEMAELSEVMGDDLGGLIRDLSIAMYVGVIAVAAVYQGWNARFYHVRIARMEDFVRRTPEWARSVLRAMWG